MALTHSPYLGEFPEMEVGRRLPKNGNKRNQVGDYFGGSEIAKDRPFFAHKLKNFSKSLGNFLKSVIHTVYLKSETLDSVILSGKLNTMFKTFSYPAIPKSQLLIQLKFNQ